MRPRDVVRHAHARPRADQPGGCGLRNGTSATRIPAGPSARHGCVGVLVVQQALPPVADDPLGTSTIVTTSGSGPRAFQVPDERLDELAVRRLEEEERSTPAPAPEPLAEASAGSRSSVTWTATTSSDIVRPELDRLDASRRMSGSAPRPAGAGAAASMRDSVRTNSSGPALVACRMSSSSPTRTGTITMTIHAPTRTSRSRTRSRRRRRRRPAPLMTALRRQPGPGSSASGGPSRWDSVNA